VEFYVRLYTNLGRSNQPGLLSCRGTVCYESWRCNLT